MTKFIPKKSEKEAISIRISIEKLEVVDAMSARYDISRNEFINQCIDFALEHMVSEEKQE